MPDTEIAFQSVVNNKNCADEGGRVICNRGHVHGWEKFKLQEIDGGMYGIKGGQSNHAKICYNDASGVKCNRSATQSILDSPPDNIDMFKFEIEQVGNGLVALKSGDGKYCRVDNMVMKCDANNSNDNSARFKPLTKNSSNQFVHRVEHVAALSR